MPPAGAVPTAWDPAPLVLAAATLALVLFARAFVTLRRRGRRDHAGWDRTVLFVAGVALATLPLVSPLDAIADDDLVSAHMLQHVLLADAAPPLILLGLRGPLLFFFVPAFILRPAAHSRTVRSVLAFALRPLVALAIWVAAVAAWHVPAAYDFALTHPFVHDLEHASFLVAGLLVWAQLIDPARRRALSLTGLLAFAGALFILGQVLSNVLLLAPRPLYAAYAAHPSGLLGLTPLADQQAAGLVMMGEQLVTLGTCVLLLLLLHAKHGLFAAGRPVSGLAALPR
jgi:putative copper resistance protein D